jgi:hypothetical protein
LGDLEKFSRQGDLVFGFICVSRDARDLFLKLPEKLYQQKDWQGNVSLAQSQASIRSAVKIDSDCG